MTIEVKPVTTQSEAVVAYKVIVTDTNHAPAAAEVELRGIGREVFEALERAEKSER